MNLAFAHRDGQLFVDDIAVADLAARFGTPLYIYSAEQLSRNYRAWAQSVRAQDRVCYAVKANSNLGVLSLLAKLGSGFDIVSRGELERVLLAGGNPAGIVYSGLGKSPDDMRRALEVGVHCFNVESEAELEQLSAVAAAVGKRAPVSIRVNPDVDARTHPYISTGLRENKFGIDIRRAEAVYLRARELGSLDLVGVDCHIGSQLVDLSPYFDALERVLELVDKLERRGIRLRHLDLGGGLGVRYRNETPPAASELCAGVIERLGTRDLHLIFEPGRSIAANAGALITRVDFLKPTEVRNFAILDASMSELIRPALYQSWMDIVPADCNLDRPIQQWDLVGAVCESADFLGKDRTLGLAGGDLLAVLGAGAYGFVMSSNYNTRPRPAEVMIQNNQAILVRERESLQDLWRGEHAL